MPDNIRLLQTMPFRQLDKWYVEYYLNTKKLNSKFNVQKLSTLITPVKRRIKKADYDGILPVVSKIVFKSGEIIFRKENKTGMDLLYIKKGDLRNGICSQEHYVFLQNYHNHLLQQPSPPQQWFPLQFWWAVRFPQM